MSTPVEWLKDNAALALSVAALTGGAAGMIHANATSPSEIDNKALKERVLLEEEERNRASIRRLIALKKARDEAREEEAVRWDGRSIV